MVPEFVARTRGSKWVQAQPCRSSCGVLHLILSKRRILRLQFMAEGFVLASAAASGCRPCLPGGSKWLSALPTRRQQVAVGPADRKSRLLNVWTLRKE